MKSITIDGIEYDLVPKIKTQYLESVTFPKVEFIVSDDEMNWDEAVKWCKDQDGRLPSIEELHAYRSQLCNYLKDKANNYFWSASTRNSYTNVALFVNLGNGYPNTASKTSSYYVICVR